MFSKEVFSITEAEFLTLAEDYNLIPVQEEVMGDQETPITLWRKLGLGQNAFLLESAAGGSQVGRYSFLGGEPILEVELELDRAIIRGASGTEAVSGAPLAVLREVFGRFRVPPSTEPRFNGGLVGYLGYDLVRSVEHLGSRKPDDRELPLGHFIIPRTFLAIDHLTGRLRLVVHQVVGPEPAASYRLARERLLDLKTRLAGVLPREEAPPKNRPLVLNREVTQDEFEGAVETAQEYIRAGDIFQVVLSQRLVAKTEARPLDVYRALRSLNPSPYLFYLQFDREALVGSSPEALARVENGLLTVRPIAGTRPRGGSEAADTQMEAELLADEKELAEHIMLVDLGRNDVGRVSQYGSVVVSRLKVVERYSHVLHLVSEVQGFLREGIDAFAALAACFPAGTLSGAPKVRAMEIIDELERLPRGPYGGAVGYFDFRGNFDAAIAIRTVVLTGGYAYLQAGAGIVADSVPAAEYRESLAKAEALIRALSLAEEGLQ